MTDGRFAILCPGQGTQHRQMFDLSCADPQVAAFLHTWALEAAIGMPLHTALGSDESFFRNALAQPLIVAATLAAWEALRRLLPDPSIVAGYSVGELAAHAVAASLSSADAVRLAAARARLMDQCVPIGQSHAMMAVSGLPRTSLAPLLPPADVAIAIDTADDSVIVGGTRGAVTALQASVMARGARTMILPVGVASHTPFMRDAARQFHALLTDSIVNDPACAVLAGISGARVTRKAHVADALSRQIAETIRWRDCMDTLQEAGIRVVLELGPGSALSAMLKTRHPSMRCRALADFRSLRGVADWVRHQLDTAH